jgi:diguanylate cyclase (GGDEF)-like protein
LDHFKRYNDAYGHRAGDLLLKEAATRWREQLRVADLLARHGGDEFGLLLPDCVLESAGQVLERLAQATPREQTCSIGFAEWDRSDAADALLDRADRALYEAKRAGRGRLKGAPAVGQMSEW